MKWLLTCMLVVISFNMVRAEEYQSFEGLRIGQTLSEVEAVVTARGGVKLKDVPLPGILSALTTLVGVPPERVDIQLVVETNSVLEPAIAIVAFDKETGGVIWLSLYPRWLGLRPFGQRVTAELVSKKYGIDEMQPDRCENDICLVGQAATGEIIVITPNLNVRVYPSPG